MNIITKLQFKLTMRGSKLYEEGFFVQYDQKGNLRKRIKKTEPVLLVVDTGRHYKFMPDGTLINGFGKPITGKNGARGGALLEFKVGGIKRAYQLNRLFYEAFSGEELTSKDYILHKDGDKRNNAFPNLKKVSAYKAHPQLVEFRRGSPAEKARRKLKDDVS